MTVMLPSMREWSVPQYSEQYSLKFPNLRRLKPRCGEPTGQYVSLDAERWDREAVNDVLRNHRQFDCASLRQVESVDLGLAVRLLRLPHPLLGDDVYLDRIGRRL